MHSNFTIELRNIKLKVKKLNPNRVLKHHQDIKIDSSNEFNSWKYCYEAFSNIHQDEHLLALNLGFYLASWGMYRGSAPISRKDYTIHIGAVKIIKKFYELRCNSTHEVVEEDITKIIKLCNELRAHYAGFKYLINDALISRSPTDTLISKIVIGTLGCCPAFDRYFNLGVKNNYKFNKICEKSFEEMFLFKKTFENDLTALQKELFKIDNYHYPLFKIIDNYFWQEGFYKDKLEKKNKQKQN